MESAILNRRLGDLPVHLELSGKSAGQASGIGVPACGLAPDRGDQSRSQKRRGYSLNSW